MTSIKIKPLLIRLFLSLLLAGSLSACEQSSEVITQLHRFTCTNVPHNLQKTLNCPPILQNRPTISIGRLICGGHLSLAVVEKKFQDQLQCSGLKIVQNQSWDDIVNDMQSGKLQGTFILSPLAMKLIREGFPGKIVLKANRNGNSFVLSKKFDNIAALKQKKTIIAVPHIFSQHHILLHMLLKSHNIPKENISIIGIPPRDMINSLKRGEIDGFLVGEPEGQRSISLDIGWMAAISPGIWVDHIDHVFLATDKFIQDQPEQLQELINQLVKAGRFIENNPIEASIMGEDYTGAPGKVFYQVLTSPPNWIDYSDMLPTVSDIQALSEKMVEMELWSTAPSNIEPYIDTRFVTKATQQD